MRRAPTSTALASPGAISPIFATFNHSATGAPPGAYHTPVLFPSAGIKNSVSGWCCHTRSHPEERLTLWLPVAGGVRAPVPDSLVEWLGDLLCLRTLAGARPRDRGIAAHHPALKRPRRTAPSRPSEQSRT